MVQNSTPNTLLSLSENGIATMGFRIDFNLAFGGGNLVQAVRALEFDTTLAPTSPYVYRFKQTIAFGTLVDWSHTLLEGNWTLSSGSNTAAFVDNHPTFSQTGTQSGVLYGYRYRPAATITTSGDYRHFAWEHNFGAIAWNSTISPTQITANQNNYSPTNLNHTTTIRIDTDASRDLTGLAGGYAGRIIAVLNIGSFNLVLKNLDAGSTAANQFSIGADITVIPGKGTLLIYDGTSTKWRSLSL